MRSKRRFWTVMAIVVAVLFVSDGSMAFRVAMQLLALYWLIRVGVVLLKLLLPVILTLLALRILMLN